MSKNSFFLFISVLTFIAATGCTKKINSSGSPEVNARRQEIISKGGLKAACTYSDFLSNNQYKGNFHCHSRHSDGSQFADSVASWYFNHGYQVISITDHDAYGDQDGGMKSTFQNDRIIHDWNGDGITYDTATYRSGNEVYVRDYSKPAPSWVPRKWDLEKPGKFIILNGIEFSIDRPHTNAINYPEGGVPHPHEGWDFIDKTHQNNGMAFLNHPRGYNSNPSRVFNNPDFRKLDGLEVVTGFGLRDNRDGKNTDGERANCENLWNGCLDAGLKWWAFADDDAHSMDIRHFAGPGSAWEMIWAKELTRPAIIEALKAGAFYATTGIIIRDVKVTKDYISVESPNATHISVIGTGGKVLMQVDNNKIKYIIKGDEKWIRIVLWNDTICYPDEGSKYVQKAWMQPIIFEI